jgi:hypothetical protein
MWVTYVHVNMYELKRCDTSVKKWMMSIKQWVFLMKYGNSTRFKVPFFSFSFSSYSADSSLDYKKPSRLHDQLNFAYRENL